MMQGLFRACLFNNLQKITYGFLKQHTKQEMRINNIPEEQLSNHRYLGKVFKKPIHARSSRSQMGLWHGIRFQSGNQSCFSEKLSRRSWAPNLQRKTFHSDILGRNFQMVVTMKAMRCIRKANSFDNYLLMTKPKQLDSLYGEYLRRIMLRRINDPTYKVSRIYKADKLGRQKRYRKNFEKVPTVWYPPEIRYKDRYLDSPPTLQESSPKMLRIVAQFQKDMDDFKDVSDDHPYLVQRRESDENNPLKEEAIKVEADFKKRLNLKGLEAYNNVLIEEEDFMEKARQLSTKPEQDEEKTKVKVKKFKKNQKK